MNNIPVCGRSVRSAVFLGQSGTAGGRRLFRAGQQRLRGGVAVSGTYRPVLWQRARLHYEAIGGGERVPERLHNGLSGCLF